MFGLSKNWMVPKTTKCINCGRDVDIYGPGYIVWDGEGQEFRRQHSGCREQEGRLLEWRPKEPEAAA